VKRIAVGISLAIGSVVPATAATYQIQAFLFPDATSTIRYDGILVLEDTPSITAQPGQTEYQFAFESLSLVGANGSQTWNRSELSTFNFQLILNENASGLTSFYYLPLPDDPLNTDARALLDGRGYVEAVTAQIGSIDSLDFDVLDSAPVDGTNGVYGELGVHIVGPGVQFQRGLAVINLNLIPEPDTLGLLALAAAFTLQRRRRRRAAH